MSNPKIIHILRRFVPPYRAQMGLNILFNLLSTLLSLFSFAAIIPILRILFGLNTVEVERVAVADVQGLQETIAALRTNMYCLLNEQIALHGAGYVLLLLGLFLVVMTGLKCLCAWLANYFMVPIRTGVLRDLRQQLYDKVSLRLRWMRSASVSLLCCVIKAISISRNRYWSLRPIVRSTRMRWMCVSIWRHMYPSSTQRR